MKKRLAVRPDADVDWQALANDALGDVERGR
jgi:hypothetical protein